MGIALKILTRAKKNSSTPEPQSAGGHSWPLGPFRIWLASGHSMQLLVALIPSLAVFASATRP
eukprot:2033736-Pyramimonas_sp.AAC.1